MSESEVLRAEKLCVTYRGVPGVSDVDLRIEPGQSIAILGPNGAGKSSVLRGLSGTATSTGSVVFKEQDVSRWRPHRRTRAGLVQVPQGGGVFEKLTVEDNLFLGALRSSRREREERIRFAFDVYPRLEERRHVPASELSGGERQMLAIGRALMAKPTIVLLDEPSLGLAPLAVKDMFSRIRLLKDLGVAMVIVDQNAIQALGLADYVYVLSRGALVYEGTAQEVRDNEHVVAQHLGLRTLMRFVPSTPAAEPAPGPTSRV